MRRNRKFSTTISKRFETLGFVKLIIYSVIKVQVRRCWLSRGTTQGREGHASPVNLAYDFVKLLATKRQPGKPPGRRSHSDLLSINFFRLSIVAVFVSK